MATLAPYLREFPQSCPTTTVAAATGDCDHPDPVVVARELQEKKYGTLINYISASVYDYIAEAADYDSAIQILEGLYIKPQSVVFNRQTCN